MSELRLFELPEPTPIASEAQRVSPDRRRTLRNRHALEMGHHPATGRSLLHPDWGYQCRDCAHRVTIQPTRAPRRYHKCLRAGPITHGPGTDIRLRWPACTLLTINQQEVTRG